MIRPSFAVIGLLLGGLVLNIGCGRQGRPIPSSPPPDVIGPRAILLRTPNALGHSDYEMSVAFSPDNRTVAAGRMESFPEGGEESSFGTAVSICDVASRRDRITIKGPFAESCSVAFSPDGRTLAVGLDRSIKLYDPQTGREQAELATEYAYGSLGLAYSSDGRRLAAATAFGIVVVWDLGTKRVVSELKAHTRSVCGVAVSPDGMFVASASDGPIVCHTSYGLFSVGVACGPDYGVVRLFDVATGQQRARLKHDWTARSVAFSPDGKLLASGGGGAAKLWDLTTNKVRTVIKAGSELDVYCVAFSSDGGTLAVGVGSRAFDGSYDEVRLWDVGLGRVQAVLKGELGKVRSLAFAPDGKTLVTGSSQAVVLWDVPPARVQNPGPVAVAAKP